jgi:hypothetical protein
MAGKPSKLMAGKPATQTAGKSWGSVFISRIG